MPGFIVNVRSQEGKRVSSISVLPAEQLALSSETPWKTQLAGNPEALFSGQWIILPEWDCSARPLGESVKLIKAAPSWLKKYYLYKIKWLSLFHTQDIQGTLLKMWVTYIFLKADN